MIYKFTSYALVLILLMSCNNKISRVNSPLASIIKIQSSEALGDFNEAKRYQNINKLYGEYGKEFSISPEKYWIDYVVANNKLARDKKITNQVKYFNYDIEEDINGDKSKVTFNNKNKSDRVQAIIYDLKWVDSIWMLQKVEYKIID
jgi:hypothetical protein